MAVCGGFGRKDQQSHAFIDAELTQLKGMAIVLPPIFLLVAAFLINITLSRLIALEREQIGLAQSHWLYTPLASRAIISSWCCAITFVGLLIGIPLGGWLGHGHDRASTHNFTISPSCCLPIPLMLT